MTDLRTRSTRMLSIAVLIVALSPFAAAATKGADEKAIDAADAALMHAIATGDADGIRAAAAVPEYWSPVVDELAKFGKEKVKLAAAVTKKFGAEGRESFIGLKTLSGGLPPGVKWKITGDTAMTVDEKYPELPTLNRARRVNGQWKIDWTDRKKEDVKQQVAWNKSDAKVAAAFAKEIAAGKYATAEEAGKAYEAALDAKFAQPEKPAKKAKKNAATKPAK